MNTLTTAEPCSITPEQVKLVLNVSRLLAVTTDLDSLLQQIAEAATGLLDAERASIFLYDPSTDQLWTKVALQSAEIRVPSHAGIVGSCFKANELMIVPDPYQDPRFNPEPDRKSGFRTRNILGAPMLDIDRKPVGVLQAINKKGGGFSAVDCAMIQLLADQAGVAIQRYRLQLTAMEAVALRHEMDLARRVQEAMLPKEVPDVPGLQVDGWTRPASVTGGDCFDFWKTPDGRLGIFVADASGHGLAPTLVVSQVRALIRAIAEVDPNPQRLLAHANARCLQDLESDRFVTAFLGFLSSEGELEWTSAGHGPILFRESADSDIVELEPPELPLGIRAELFNDPISTLQMKPGGSIAIVSDGISEAMNAAREQFDTSRVISLLNETKNTSPDGVSAALRDAVQKWQGHDEPVDDQTVVVVRRPK
jgi:phosphoserine phosphatase